MQRHTQDDRCRDVDRRSRAEDRWNVKRADHTTSTVPPGRFRRAIDSEAIPIHSWRISHRWARSAREPLSEFLLRASLSVGMEIAYYFWVYKHVLYRFCYLLTNPRTSVRLYFRKKWNNPINPIYQGAASIFLDPTLFTQDFSRYKIDILLFTVYLWLQVGKTTRRFGI